MSATNSQLPSVLQVATIKDIETMNNQISGETEEEPQIETGE